MSGLKTYSFLLYLSSLWAIGGTQSEDSEPDIVKIDEYDTPVTEVDTTESSSSSNHELDLPAYFDARLKWGEICRNIEKIGNQGKCKSGWAMAISSVIADRWCIATSGKTQTYMSAMNLLSCCPNCCGCAGSANVLNAWRFVRDVGLVSGSMNVDFRLDHEDGCQPYKIKPLSKSDLVNSSTQGYQTPVCTKYKCTNPHYTTEKLIHYKIDRFEFFSRNRPDLIMKELMTNGPLQVSFFLFEDFRYFKADKNCSVYVHAWGRYEGIHAAKLVGWGTTEGNIKYWLLVNSFGRHWGCKGTFRVPRHVADHIHFGFAIVAPHIFGNGSVAMTADRFHTVLVGLSCAAVLLLNAYRTRPESNSIDSNT